MFVELLHHIAFGAVWILSVEDNKANIMTLADNISYNVDLIDIIDY